MTSLQSRLVAEQRSKLSFELLDHRLGIEAQIFRLNGLLPIQHPNAKDKLRYREICSNYIHHLRMVTELEQYAQLQGWDTSLWQPRGLSDLSSGQYQNMERYRV